MRPAGIFSGDNNHKKNNLMKTYFNIRVTKANSLEEAIENIQNGIFDESHPKSDTVTEIDPTIKKNIDIEKVLELLVTVRTSCEEGHSEEWDCTTDEGREGFMAMIDQLDEMYNLLTKK